MTKPLIFGEGVNVEIPCATLRRYREESRMTQHKLAFACWIAEFAMQYPPDRAFDMNTVLSTLAYFGENTSVDATNISNFEMGHKRPWSRAIKALCYVFTVIHKREVTPQELFPELFDNQPPQSIAAAATISTPNEKPSNLITRRV